MCTECTQDRYIETYFRKPWGREFFSCMGPEAQKAFDALKEPRSFRAGQQVYAQGEPAQGIFILVSGKLSVRRKCAQGRFQILQILLPGDSVGVIPVFDGEPTSCSVVAHTEATCWFLPAEPLRRLAFKHEEVGEAIHRHICAKFRNLVAVLEGMSLHSVPERVAKLLLDQHRRNPGRSLLEFPEGEEDLAHYIACSRSTFSRALRQLDDEGMIRNTFPVIRLVDLPRLEAFASCGAMGLDHHRARSESAPVPR
ncbi:MAG: Crp/Fnr family transcriptional regulator [Holophagaceae bacterium]|nr:Crp/Fnr family transcriptional regulator [Holophagaceae bacterium]